MIRLRQIKVNINDDIDVVIKNKCSKKLRISPSMIKEYKIHDESIDARHKPDIYFVYTIDVLVDNEIDIISRIKDNDVLLAPIEEYEFIPTGNNTIKNRPVIVGAGPAGLMCAYMLSCNGYKPLVIERGKKVEDRVKDVEEFWTTGVLNTESNVQFGEGGAGTFSDGKLVSQVKDSNFRKKKAFEIFVEAGADESILYKNKPHIGTDKLRNIVKNIREKIISMGGEFRYNTCLTDIEFIDNEVSRVEVNNNEWIDTNIVVTAIGHSARDTFKMLYSKNIDMQAKPFAVGVRIQHLQKDINKNQYGVEESKLGAASYKLTYKATNGRGVYSFCMCPGGFVVNASSEEGMLAINGMSNNARESDNANSALIVTITPDDFGTNPLDGIEFQRKLEKKAFEIGKGLIPVQLYGDYKNNIISTKFNTIKPIFKGNYTFASVRDIFPNYINDSLIESIEYFGGKIKGYNSSDAIVAGVESRTSSPVKIIRDEYGVSNIKGLYPCGEGAGYAGGITSACIDGIKVAEFIESTYTNK